MLMPSHRHTEADLELWRELEHADKVHGISKELAKKACRAIETIGQFAVKGPCYLGVSWGKDSIVAAALAASATRIYPVTIPLVWVRVEPICNPDCEAVRDAFLSAHPCQYREIVVRCHCDGDGWHATGTLESGFAQANAEFGRRHISGVRADESGTRNLSVRRFGESTATACRPLAHWTARDIYGWAARKNLPLHPAYAMTGGGRWARDRIRVASLGGKRGDGAGRAEWESEYYSDQLNRLGHQR